MNRQFQVFKQLEFLRTGQFRLFKNFHFRGPAGSGYLIFNFLKEPAGSKGLVLKHQVLKTGQF